MGASQSQENHSNHGLLDEHRYTGQTRATTGSPNPEAQKYGVASAGNSKPEVQKHGMATAGNSKPDAQKYGVATTANSKPDTHKYGVATTESSKPGTHKYGVATTERFKQDTRKIGMITLGAAKHEAQKYGMASAGNSKPEVQKHGMATAENLKPDAQKYGVATAANSKPDTHKYGVATTESSKPGTHKYGVATTESFKQDTPKIGVMTAGDAKHEAQKYGVATGRNMKQEAEQSNWKAKTEVGLTSKDVSKSKETNVPHNFALITKDADSRVDCSSTEKLLAQLYQGVFLNNKRQKLWVEANSNKNCFMLYARNLSITWAEDNRFWQWKRLKESNSDAEIDVAELLNVCWLEVHLKFETAKLSPGTHYEALLVIMLKDSAYGWDFPINLRLILPNRNKQEHKENLAVQPRGKWMEIPIGNFTTSTGNDGEIDFYVYEYEAGTWKSGLVIKGIAIRPKMSAQTILPN